jgi:TonB family protein
MAAPGKLEFGLLPEKKRDWRTFAVSYGFVTVIILLLLGVKFLYPETLQFTQRYTVTEIIPRPDLQPEPVQPVVKIERPIVAKLAPPVSFSTPKLIVPKDIRQQPKLEEKEPPKLETQFKPPDLAPLKPTVAKVIYTGAFGSSAQATITAPIEKVQTGGFGDPNGLPGKGKDNAHLTATQLGSFDLPAGPGKGNGSGGANGIQGTIASAGFGNGIAVGDGRNNRGTVQASGFASQELAHGNSKLATTDSGPATTPVEIISKPKPVYTDEARQLKLEGEVLLEVMFGANGQSQVNRVVRGLGHGLDESAMAAASQMRFKPALRNGIPVDSTAIVHVVFQLAY